MRDRNPFATAFVWLIIIGAIASVPVIWKLFWVGLGAAVR